MTPSQRRKYVAFMGRMVRRVNDVPANADAAARRGAANIGAEEKAFMRKTLTKRQYRAYLAELEKLKRQRLRNIQLLNRHPIGRM